jgi:hypothetical protein
MHILADLAPVNIKGCDNIYVSRLIAIHFKVHQAGDFFRAFIPVIVNPLNK